jgi:hypothetical protein
MGDASKNIDIRELFLIILNPYGAANPIMS